MHNVSFCNFKDDSQIKHAAIWSTEQSKEARTARLQASVDQNQFYEREEELLYGPGIAD